MGTGDYIKEGDGIGLISGRKISQVYRDIQCYNDTLAQVMMRVLAYLETSGAYKKYCQNAIYKAYNIGPSRQWNWGYRLWKSKGEALQGYDVRIYEAVCRELDGRDPPNRIVLELGRIKDIGLPPLPKILKSYNCFVGTRARLLWIEREVTVHRWGGKHVPYSYANKHLKKYYHLAQPTIEGIMATLRKGDFPKYDKKIINLALAEGKEIFRGLSDKYEDEIG